MEPARITTTVYRFRRPVAVEAGSRLFRPGEGRAALMVSAVALLALVAVVAADRLAASREQPLPPLPINPVGQIGRDETRFQMLGLEFGVAPAEVRRLYPDLTTGPYFSGAADQRATFRFGATPVSVWFADPTGAAATAYPGPEAPRGGLYRIAYEYTLKRGLDEAAAPLVNALGEPVVHDCWTSAWDGGRRCHVRWWRNVSVVVDLFGHERPRGGGLVTTLTVVAADVHRQPPSAQPYSQSPFFPRGEPDSSSSSPPLPLSSSSSLGPSARRS
jgi:hypothetical protein